ncbi:MAG: TIGR01777 family oxidoreductase [Chlamydiota bacterium]
MKILITGASGLVGSALSLFLEEMGHLVGKVVREKKGEGNQILWNPMTGEGEVDLFEGWDVVVHLAGESLSKGLWTKNKKKRILDSRVVGTRNLVKILDSCKSPPKVFISASAIGFYGSQEGRITEETSSGEGFLSKVCVEWERAAEGWKNQKTRKVVARFGFILSSKGGFFKVMKSLFSWGLGGKMGTGQQFISWITVDDLVKALYHIVEKEDLEGAVNMVSPKPVTQGVFALTLAKVLHRPCFFSIPKCFLLGEKAKELILPSLKVYPVKLQKSGFIFQHQDLMQALRYLDRIDS